MRARFSSLVILLISSYLAKAQVAINTTGANPDNSAMLDISSSTRGLLIPRMTTAERTAISSPATGLLVYDNSLSLFYYYNGTAWTSISPVISSWATVGNILSGTSFLGTTDNQHLDIRTNNTLHARIRTNGQIEVLNTGRSTYLGESAGINDDLNNRRNVAIGYNALRVNSTAAGNTAVGYLALENTTANSNTAVGYQTLTANTTGNWNSAIGQEAMSGNLTGVSNTAAGGHALGANTTGNSNAALGYNAMLNNTTGSNNVGVGESALSTNTTGNNNVAIGYNADVTAGNLTNAIAIGYNAKVAQSNSLILGGTGADAVSVGIGTTTPLSTLDVTGSLGMTVKNSQVAGTNNPDNTASIWLYTSGTGTITLPTAASSARRMYVIVNKTGATLNISSYTNLTGAATTTFATATSITILSDGTNWMQIR
jgi:trimeric autotransporter adhesin